MANTTSAGKTSTPKKNAREELKKMGGVEDEPMMRQLLNAANK